MINGTHVRHLRIERGLSQRKLADLIGTSYQTIRRLEAGADASDQPLRVIARLADALQVDIADLLTGQTRGPSRPSEGEDQELDASAARLLRAVTRGDASTRSLSARDRQFTLPALVRTGVLHTESAAFEASEAVTFSCYLDDVGQQVG
jgi:transcriptional regulator with XRE-family HTH domain